MSQFVKGKILPSIFTFRKELVMSWLENAKVILEIDYIKLKHTFIYLTTHYILIQVELYRNKFPGRRGVLWWAALHSHRPIHPLVRAAPALHMVEKQR